MLSETGKKERLSLAHIIAVATSVGYSVEIISADKDSVDLTIRARGFVDPGKKGFCSPALDVQLKAHSCDPPSASKFSYKLKQKNYRDLIEKRRLIPIVLILYALP